MDDMREEINEIKGSMEKVMEMLQALIAREEPHMHTVIFEISVFPSNHHALQGSTLLG